METNSLYPEEYAIIIYFKLEMKPGAFWPMYILFLQNVL